MTSVGPGQDGELLAAIVGDARQADPGLPGETAELLARSALDLGRPGSLAAPDLARRLLAAHPEPGATAANVVAVAAARLWSSPEDGAPHS